MNTTKRNAAFAQKFIDDVEQQTSIEQLTTLLHPDYFKTGEMQKEKYSDNMHPVMNSLGKRTLECQEVFAEKYVELAVSEPQVLLGILSFRGGWENKGYCRDSVWGCSTWNVVSHIQDHLTIDIQPVESDEYYRLRGEWRRLENWKYKIEEKTAVRTERIWNTETEECEGGEVIILPSIQDQIIAKYKLLKNLNPDITKQTLVSLIKKLKTFEGCKLVYATNHNNDEGEALIELMREHAKSLEEVFFTMNCMFNKKDGRTLYKKELKTLSEKFSSLL